MDEEDDSADPQKECMMPLANTLRGIVLLETVYKAKREMRQPVDMSAMLGRWL